MSKNKSQHYVPAFYLYNFTSDAQRIESKDKQKRETKIYHFDFEKGGIRERPIKKLAIEPYLLSHKNVDGNYNHNLDKEIQKVEDKASKAITELDEILKFLLRTKPKSFEIANQLMDSVLELLFWQIKRHPEIVNELVGECEQYLFEKGESTQRAKEMALGVVKQIGKDNNFDIMDELHKKNKIIVCTSSEQAQFITTDKPFVRFNKNGRNGIAAPGTEMYYPLTSKMLLFMHNNGNRKEFRLENHRSYLRELNTYIAKAASNYLFGKNDKYLLKISKIIG